MGRRGALTGAVVAFALTSCDGPARPQLLVTVNTDLAVPSQITADPTLSASSSINRVRVETLSADGSVQDTRDFLLTDPTDLPLSFGVEETTSGATARVRVTGFRERDASSTGDVTASLGVAVVRLVESPVDSVSPLSIDLRADCIGVPSDVLQGTTCVDSAGPVVSPSTGPFITTIPLPGSWPSAREVACTSDAPAGTTCIAGGVSEIGDSELATVDATSDLIAAPPRLAIVAPFFLDTDEMTIAQFRKIAAMPAFAAALPTLASIDASCNYSSAPGKVESEAVRCVSFDTARAACRAIAADLPTVAQWEHAARGRGLAYRYPWGDDPPMCCAAALAKGLLGCLVKSNAGAYTDPSSCNGIADVSRDGVLDLAGDVREWVLDAATDFDTCFAPGVLTNPMCAPAGSPLGSTKGGSFLTTLDDAASALRRGGSQTSDVGFRCAR